MKFNCVVCGWKGGVGKYVDEKKSVVCPDCGQVLRIHQRFPCQICNEEFELLAWVFPEKENPQMLKTHYESSSTVPVIMEYINHLAEHLSDHLIKEK